MTGRVFDFTHALLRKPGRSAVDGLRENPQAVPSFDGIAAEHEAYASALRDAGLDVEVLPPLEDFPDSIFVEDPALVFPELAILLRPGAPSRQAEREHMRPALRRHFPELIELAEGENADGGDILVTPDCVLIGLSARTSQRGAEAIIAHLGGFGRKAAIAQTPGGVLHFKTACALLDDETILAAPSMALSGVFDGFHVLLTPAGEHAAANALRVKDRVFVGASYRRTQEMLAAAGYQVVPLAVDEIAKLDAGLSCMSLRW